VSNCTACGQAIPDHNPRLRVAIAQLFGTGFLAERTRTVRYKPEFWVRPAEIWEALEKSKPTTHETAEVGKCLAVMGWKRSYQNGQLLFIKGAEL
jgi:hypothetical protein